ncbi:hypothetical protein DRP05_11425, partial [Archaeoglobales archaeon]
QRLRSIIPVILKSMFEIGLAIFATTFIGCIGYLFYDWRKEMVGLRRLENKIKSVLNRIWRKGI